MVFKSNIWIFDSQFPEHNLVPPKYINTLVLFNLGILIISFISKGVFIVLIIKVLFNYSTNLSIFSNNAILSSYLNCFKQLLNLVKFFN